MDGTSATVRGVILTGQRFSSRHSDLIFNPIVLSPPRRRDKSPGVKRDDSVMSENDRLFGFAFIGLRNVHENQSAKFFVYKAICHPEVLV